ncbi:histone-like nucleoid-structuring protein Lsr2 [Gryllotalpicola ginsengisoli]|uniref:histone-like nucleoid-structuring protein Lsr2 n=1 Tax=Gryllotalpicola ginsengisoli TaxID=444608 RepID=UPI0003B52660|nr:Lsr2 family protein [Gryllotalpicola ginsengisoli]
MRKVVEQLVDDLTGEEIPAGEGETIRFSIGGSSYEIDLSEKNVKKFNEALKPFIDVARQTGRQSAPAARTRRTSSRSTSRWSAGYGVVREWAQANGIEVSKQGRVADSVMEAYEAAHK